MFKVGHQLSLGVSRREVDPIRPLFVLEQVRRRLFLFIGQLSVQNLQVKDQPKNVRIDCQTFSIPQVQVRLLESYEVLVSAHILLVAAFIGSQIWIILSHEVIQVCE